MSTHTCARTHTHTHTQQYSSVQYQLKLLSTVILLAVHVNGKNMAY